jgi:hypothetical protein
VDTKEDRLGHGGQDVPDADSPFATSIEVTGRPAQGGLS